ncbi:ArnT family glycosyltransferase [Flagellimonas lutaonensis]|uniref:4-amino-4-deoxy-L-arabinose transferase n=1 Tax=Flagellimonas lutaonensis TaxID=516051 RepID=A0A0D5YS71_9FLAO|nr:glycosyltransferase family 39 protein [Allomuricauda lutaonensis]AKA34723.1 4-amino-4-deoxy-L-arabinose transferase [Allomuricauda lutaonensis]
MTKRFPKLFIYLLSALFLLNIVQSFFTELIYDEAYYWYYAQDLAWGYFDHPPMVAFLAKISSFFFDGELGVRFMGCILGVGTFLVLWQLIASKEKHKYVPFFFVLLFSMPLLNAYGFLTLPDTPLLFFTTLFLLIYKKFLERATIGISLALGLVMAALMYSKYHAVLVILFVFLSNVALIRNRFAWLAVATALVCYFPHFAWLYNNDLVTIKYHLFERPNQPYSFEKFTLGYILNLVLVFGLLFPWVYWALLKTKAKDRFKKALQFLAYGVILFFFLSSFNRRVQTQWIIVICIPLAILTYEYFLSRPTPRKWIMRLGLTSTAILLFARVGLVHEPLFPVVYETHGNKEWVNTLKEKAGDIPVVFENSYRRAPMYAFYSGNTSYSLNNFHYRQNQYSIDDSEEKVQNRRVLYVTKYAKKGDISYTNARGTLFYGIFIDNFRSYRKLRCLVEDLPIDLQQDSLMVKVYNPYPHDIDLGNLTFHVAYLNAHKQLQESNKVAFSPLNGAIDRLKSNDTTYFRCTLKSPTMKDIEYIKFGISEFGLRPGINSSSYKLEP